MPADTENSPDEIQEVTALVSRLVINGVFDLPRQNRLNARFPDVRPLTMREFLEKTWQKQ